MFHRQLAGTCTVENMNRWMNMKDLANYPEVTGQEAKKAMSHCVSQVKRNLPEFADRFPAANSQENHYAPGENLGWTTGFWTGEVWLAYENAETKEDQEAFKQAGNLQVQSFLERIHKKLDVDHHDMGFLYSPSCVAAYKLTGSKEGREAALLAAGQLVSRFQPVGQFIQAWGAYGAPDNYRLIIDCLLNLPLLYWASEETGDGKYRDVAEKHIHTAMKYVIREDDSTWHTIFMDMETGGFHHGATCQGYKDGSAWARGQAWGVYGTAMAYKYTRREEYIGYFKRVSKYFLEHLPDDLCPFWDLTFGNGDEKEEPRDSSSSAIVACGMLEMSKYLEGQDAAYYSGVARKLLKSLVDHYQVTDPAVSNGQLLGGTYCKKTPYNTCQENGVDECVIWGDYYFMEGLNRLLNPGWKLYW